MNNIRTLRAQAHEVDLATPEEILEKLTSNVEDRRQEDAAVIVVNTQREEKLENYRKQLLEDGIDPSELLGNIQTGKTKNHAPFARLNI